MLLSTAIFFLCTSLRNFRKPNFTETLVMDSPFPPRPFSSLSSPVSHSASSSRNWFSSRKMLYLISKPSSCPYFALPVPCSYSVFDSFFRFLFSLCSFVTLSHISMDFSSSNPSLFYTTLNLILLLISKTAWSSWEMELELRIENGKILR